MALERCVCMKCSLVPSRRHGPITGHNLKGLMNVPLDVKINCANCCKTETKRSIEILVTQGLRNDLFISLYFMISFNVDYSYTFEMILCTENSQSVQAWLSL